MTSLLHDAIPPGLSDEQLRELLRDLDAAAASLAGASEVSADVRCFVRELPGRLQAESPTRALRGDPYLAEHVFAGAARAAAGLLEDEPVTARRTARLALEQVRQALRDLLEGQQVDEDVPAREVALWLERVLSLPQSQLAALIGTSPRTWQRWITTSAEPEPYLALRLRRIARLTAQLRHSLTGPGVARWFTRPHPLIKDGAGCPADLLDEPEGYWHVQRLAAGLRSTQAS